MKKGAVIGIIMTAVLALFYGCEFLAGPDTPFGGGNLVVSAGTGGAREAYTDEEINGFRYVFSFAGPGGEVFDREVLPGTPSVAVSSVALGEWTIGAKAYNVDDILMGTGSLTVTVRAGSNPVKIPMTAVERTATVTGVSVDPASATVYKGGTAQFSAEVEGTGNPAQTVTWSIDEAVVSGTGIDEEGLLTVAAGETAASFTVRATSTVDTGKSGTATVTVEPFTTPAQYRSMVYLAGGTITGSGSAGAFISGRTVILSPFKIAKYETTYELWKEVYDWAGTHGYSIANPGVEGHGTTGTGTAAEAVRKTRPVTTIHWRDAIIWCNAYSEMSGKEPVYYTNGSYTTVLRTSTNDSETSTEADLAVMKSGADGYRLPTEAEWEFAARGGSQADTTEWGYTYAGSGTVGNVAWYNVNSSSLGTGNAAYGAHPVGTKEDNRLGLYDMSGNVYEWCWDWSGSITTGEVTNPIGPATGSLRVARSGGWGDSATYCAVDQRNNSAPNNQGYMGGFRVVCP